ncbi:unnamed protein product [Penicillium bialowiezense]
MDTERRSTRHFLTFEQCHGAFENLVATGHFTNNTSIDPGTDLQVIVKGLEHNRRWDSFRPKLTHAQWEVCEKHYGGWTAFVDHYGLKRPWEKVQIDEGVKILDIIARRLADYYPESPLRTAA